jgi:hypothetical protein
MHAQLLTRCCVVTLTWLGVAAIMVGCQSVTPAPPSTPLPTLAPTPTLTADQKLWRPLKGDGPSVYRLHPGGVLRSVPDWATFLALGYTPRDVLTVPQAELTAYRLGAPLSRLVTGETDQALYLLHRGQRYPVTDWGQARLIPDFPHSVALLTDAELARFPLGTGNAPMGALFADDAPRVIAAAAHDGALWIAFETGDMLRLDARTELWALTRSAGQGDVGQPVPLFTVFSTVNGVHYRASSDGKVLRFVSQEAPTSLFPTGGAGWITALTTDGEGGLYVADANHYSLRTGKHEAGRGLWRQLRTKRDPSPLEPRGADALATDPLREVTALAHDVQAGVLWAGTRSAGLLRIALEDGTMQAFNTFGTTPLAAFPDNTIRDLQLAADGALWVAMPSQLARYADGVFKFFKLPEGVSTRGMFALSPDADGETWFAGEFVVGRVAADGTLRTYSGFDHPSLVDHFSHLLRDEKGQMWLVGRHGLVRVTLSATGETWTAYPYAGKADPFTLGTLPSSPLSPPLTFPDPTTDYTAWLKTWPRPEGDNGRGMHYLQAPSGDDFEARLHIARMKALGIRWVLVNYTSRAQLLQLAPLFARARMMAIWRPWLRAYVEYDHWAEDVAFLRSLGLPPYMQIYNEPSLGQEWDDRPIDQALYLKHALPAIRAVYDAGGYVGLQHIDQEWLRVTLRRMKAEEVSDVFNRLYFLPHPYGFNHPPDYAKDEFGVLGFRFYAQVFREEIGFVPMMIAGEGGWRPGEAQDGAFPSVSDELHRDYHRAVYQWFATGTLSDGEPLPDYLFAFCTWLIADTFDSAAWFDSESGDRRLTIDAISALPDAKRRFSFE